MGLVIGGLQSATPSTASVIASLVGQDIVAKSISLTQASGSNAVTLVTGARLKVGSGTTDYFSSNGTDTITAAGQLTGTTALNTGGNITMTGTGATLDLQSSTTGIYFSSASGNAGIDSNISAANAGATAAAAAIKLFCQQVLDSTDFVVSVGNAANAASLWAVSYNGSQVCQSTDSTGTPGSATIDKPSGRSSIALGAATVTITSACAFTTSRIFISPGLRDATGLLPTVTTRANGSFAVTTTANCTAALPFDWWIIN